MNFIMMNPCVCVTVAMNCSSSAAAAVVDLADLSALCAQLASLIRPTYGPYPPCHPPLLGTFLCVFMMNVVM